MIKLIDNIFKKWTKDVILIFILVRLKRLKIRYLKIKFIKHIKRKRCLLLNRNKYLISKFKNKT